MSGGKAFLQSLGVHRKHPTSENRLYPLLSFQLCTDVYPGTSSEQRLATDQKRAW